jgi:membrane protein YqaA with SNARE-associated domain
LKDFFLKLIAKWKFLVLPALAKLGFWGVGLIAIIDAASLPVPMDLILAGYVWANKGHFWLYILVAAAGSAIGGLLPYGLGRAGGELFLLKRVNRENFEKMRIRFERQEFLAVLVPSMLPPPTPWKAIIFAAGVFEMHVMPFMLAVFVGRVVRWLILSLLVIKLGPTAVSIVEHMISDHLQIFLGSLVLIFLAIGIWAILKMRKGGDSARPPKATQGEIK